jgi:hypothetical protein
MRRRTLLGLCSALALLPACAPPSTPMPGPDRVLITDSDGRVIRRSTSDEMSRTTFAAPVQNVWPALVLSYADLGIEPTVADRAAGRYGNGGFVMPRRFNGRGIGDFFHCGSGLTGPLVDAGRLTANVVTTIASASGESTVAVTYVTGTLRRNDGSSTDPVLCASTGALEETLRRGIEARLAGKP